MTELNKPTRRVTRGALDGSFGSDRGRRLVVTLEVGDVIAIRPAGTRRSEIVSLFDVYRLAIQRRVNCERLEKARAKKARLEQQRRDRAWQREISKARREASQ